MTQATNVNRTPRAINKLSNRRLYDTVQKRHINLRQFGELIAEGVEIVVVDKATGEDVTSTLLWQVISVMEQDHQPLLTQSFLLAMIRMQETGPRQHLACYLEQSLNLFLSRSKGRRAVQLDQHEGTARRLAQRYFNRWLAVEHEVERKLEAG